MVVEPFINFWCQNETYVVWCPGGRLGVTSHCIHPGLPVLEGVEEGGLQGEVKTNLLLLTHGS